MTSGRSAFGFEAPVHAGTAAELRMLADRLNAIAESLDPSGTTPVDRRLAGHHANAEQRLPQLARVAKLEYDRRRTRSRHLPADLLGEPAWDILLDLLIRQSEGQRVSVTGACLASDVPESTALRWITALHAGGLVNRTPARHDKRVVWLELTQAGLEALDHCLAARARVPSGQTRTDALHSAPL